MTETATLNRLTETVFPPMPQGVTAVETPPSVGDPVDRSALYVCRVANEERDSEFVGRILSSRPAASGDGWIALLPNTDYMGRVYGAVLNPELCNDRVYLVRGRVIVRYNDLDHAGDRHRATRPFSILAAADGTPWPVEDDAIGTLNPAEDIWIEVNFETAPQVSDVGHPEAVQEAEPEAAGVVEVVSDNTLEGPLRGLGEPNENGLVLKNPARVYGEDYVIWTGDVRNPFIATWFDNGEGGAFVYHGYAEVYGGEVSFESVQRTPFPGHNDDSQISWAKLRMKRATPVEDTSRVQMLRQELSGIRSSFSDFNEALNERADNEGHCSDYDAIIEKLGMETRTKEWCVEVSVDVTFTDSSPSSSLDSQIERDYGFSISTTEVRIEGTLTTSVTVTASSEDAARDAVSSEDIEAQIENLGDFEINDWNITDVSRAD